MLSTNRLGLILALFFIPTSIFAEAAGISLAKDINLLWVLISAALVFFMQAGFLMLEAGMVRIRNTINVAIKNLSDIIIGTIAFFLVGYAIMFGESSAGWVGTNLFALEGLQTANEYVFFLFQMTFMATAATITSGAIAERFAFKPYLVVAFFIGLVIYPVFGHWVWGGGWLAELGFVDFAGATVVHSVGGWVALAGVILVGPRIDRFNKDGTPNDLYGHDMPSAVLGCFILWLGWIGFNGGSQLTLDKDTISIIVKTMLAAAAGGFMAIVHSFFTRKLVRVESIINGLLAGLVGITAGCHIVPFWSALVIGGAAAIIALVGERILLHQFKLDDVISAFPVHGLAGIWGTFAVALFAQDPNITIATQLLGISVAAVWAFGLAFILIYLLKLTFGIRVSDEDQRQGLNYTEHGAKTTWLDLVDSMAAISEGDADLSKKLEIEYGSESGAVAQLFNRIIDRISELVRLVQLQSKEMDASSSELASAAEAIAAAVTEQSAEMDSFSHSVQSLKKAMQSIDKTSAEQTEEIGKTKIVTDSVITDFDEFKTTVTSTSSSANELSKTMDVQHALVESSSARLEDMRQVSTRIGSIVEILSAISKQLNLLSINAAIEAARSGEAGKGFSIVAMEINNLSNQTSESTSKAGNFLQEVDAIIDGSLAEFKQITNNFTELRNMVHKINESGESMVRHNENYRVALNNVANTMASSETLTGTLRKSTRDQMNEVDQVSQNIQNLAFAIQDLSAQTEELHATSESLRSNSRIIRKSVDKFKVEDDIN